MSENPANLALRFLLELAALAALGYWGWVAHDGAHDGLDGRPGRRRGRRLGVFRVPGDGGPPVVAVPGWAALIEAAVFGGATAALIAAGQTTLGSSRRRRRRALRDLYDRIVGSSAPATGATAPDPAGQAAANAA